MRSEGIEHRAAKISLVTGFSTLLSIGLQFISVTVCLSYWGKESYGCWLALYSAHLLIRSLEAGYVSYVGNKLNCLYHQDQKALREHLSSAVTGVAVTGTIQLAAGIAAIAFSRLSLLLGISSQLTTNLRTSLALLVLIGTWVLSGSYLGIVHRLLIPAGLMYQAAWWAMAFQVSQFVALIVAATRHFDVLQTSLLFALVQSVVYLASAEYIRRKLPSYFPWWRGCRSRVGVADLGRSVLLSVSNFVQQGTVNGSVLLISVISGPSSVPIFSTVRTLSNLWTNVTNVLTAPLLPEVVRYHAKGEGAKLAIGCETYWVLVGTAVNAGILITYPLIDPIYAYWTNHTLLLNKPLLCELLASVMLINVGGYISLFFNGINSLRILLFASLARGIFSLLLGGWLSLRLGLAGFGLGIVVGELIALALQSYGFIKGVLLGYGVHLPMHSLMPVAVSSLSLLLFLATEGLGFHLGWYIYCLAIIAVLASGIFGWIGLDPGVRSAAVQLISKRIKKQTLA